MTMTLRAKACRSLLPCPFCGHNLRDDDPLDVIYPTTRDGTVWGVHCSTGNGGCHADELMSQWGFDTGEDA